MRGLKVGTVVVVAAVVGLAFAPAEAVNEVAGHPADCRVAEDHRRVGMEVCFAAAAEAEQALVVGLAEAQEWAGLAQERYRLGCSSPALTFGDVDELVD